MGKQTITDINKKPHFWQRTPYGYDPANYCSGCGASNYETSTLTCEDYEEEKRIKQEKAERRHAPTEAAWNRARQVLTKEEWDLMQLELKCGRVYRERDFIR